MSQKYFPANLSNRAKIAAVQYIRGNIQTSVRLGNLSRYNMEHPKALLLFHAFQVLAPPSPTESQSDYFLKLYNTASNIECTWAQPACKACNLLGGRSTKRSKSRKRRKSRRRRKSSKRRRKSRRRGRIR